MAIAFELPQHLEQDLRERCGDLDRAAKEAFLLQGYREGLLSVGQIARILEKGILETQAWLGERGVPLNYSPEDLEDDRKTIIRLFRENPR